MNRKDEHIKFAKEETIFNNDFDLIKIENVSLPLFELEDISLNSSFLNKEFELPFYINAMTGGSDKAKDINRKLAFYAKEFNIPMIVGSQSAAIKNSALSHTYKVVREINPKGFIVANLSANATLLEAFEAIKMIDANAISIHINLIQELVMTEGDRKFTHWQKNIKSIVENINVPVIVKEVGFGMSTKTIEQLISLGVKNIDVSGKGGTNFATIERKRSEKKHNFFENVGISTVDSLINGKNKQVNLYASGGIRSALDIFKALYLGAKSVGLSNFFLMLTDKEDEEAINEINTLINELKMCFLVFGYKSVDELRMREE